MTIMGGAGATINAREKIGAIEHMHVEKVDLQGEPRINSKGWERDSGIATRRRHIDCDKPV